VAYWLSNDIKIIDLGLPWRSLTTTTVGYPSDSWASCCYLLQACVNNSYDYGEDGDDAEMEVDVKTNREIAELSKMKDSGAAQVILEELRKKKLEKTTLDPRSSSRMPSAAAEPPYRPRYDSPLFACE